MYMRSFLVKLKRFLRRQPVQSCIHGKCFYSNSLIDTLFPKLVEIGDNFVSAPGSVILAHDASLVMHTGKYRVQKVKIGNRVFLGANSVILPGVTIGDNVIIGASTIVTKDIPSGVVVVGNPGRVIGRVEDYISKCEDKGVALDANIEFLNCIKSDRKYDEGDLNMLRNFIYKQLMKCNV